MVPYIGTFKGVKLASCHVGSPRVYIHLGGIAFMNCDMHRNHTMATSLLATLAKGSNKVSHQLQGDNLHSSNLDHPASQPVSPLISPTPPQSPPLQLVQVLDFPADSPLASHDPNLVTFPYLQ